METVTKAVLPIGCACFGARAACEVVRTELLPLVYQPVLNFVIDEAVEAGIDTVVVVTDPDQPDCRAHIAASVGRLGAAAPSVSFVESKGGAREALLNARAVIGDESFAMAAPGKIFRSQRYGALSQVIAAYEEFGGAMLGVERRAARIGEVGYAIAPTIEADVFRVLGDSEKAGAASVAPVDRFVFDRSFWRALEAQTSFDAAIRAHAAIGGVHALEVYGEAFDCETPQGFALANIAFAIRGGVADLDFTAQAADLLMDGVANQAAFRQPSQGAALTATA